MAIVRGSPAYRRLTLAMTFAGFSTFSLLYSVQPLLPPFAHDFRLSAEGASLAVSLATGPLAIGILFAGAFSDRIGRRPMMIAAMFLAGLFTLAAAVVPGWPLLLACHLLTGHALAGMPRWRWPMSARRSILARSDRRWGCISPAALYLFFYCLGSGPLGSAGGVAEQARLALPGCIALGSLALVISLILRGIPPLTQNVVTPPKPLGTD